MGELTTTTTTAPTTSGPATTTADPERTAVQGTGYDEQSASLSTGGDGKRLTSNDWERSQKALYAAADIFQRQTDPAGAGAGIADAAFLSGLFEASTGLSDGSKLSSADRLQKAQGGMAGLDQHVALYESSADHLSWVTDQVIVPEGLLEASLQNGVARDRVDGAILTEDEQVIEGGYANPFEEAIAMRPALPALTSTLSQLRRVGLKVADVDGELQTLATDTLPAKWATYSSPADLLANLRNLLLIIDPILMATDAEKMEDLATQSNEIDKIGDLADFTKMVVSTCAGIAGIAATFGGLMSRATLPAKEVATAVAGARAATLQVATNPVVGKVLTVCTLVSNMAVLLDPDSTADERVDAGVGAASSLAFLIGGTAGTAFGVALLVSYWNFKFWMNELARSKIAITAGWMSKAYDTIADSGQRLSKGCEDLVKAATLAENEKDPAQRDAMERLVSQFTNTLGQATGDFLKRTEPVGYGPGVAYEPGAYKSLTDAFAPVRQQYSPLVSGDRQVWDAGFVLRGAEMTLETMVWAAENHQDLVTAEAGLGTVPDGPEYESPETGVVDGGLGASPAP